MHAGSEYQEVVGFLSSVFHDPLAVSHTHFCGQPLRSDSR